MAFDLDAVIAERKTERTPFEFTLAGETFQLPDELDGPGMLQVNDGDFEGGLTRLLGREGYERIMATGHPLGDVTLDALFGAWADHLGIDLGEALASAASSNRTARRSRPTSNGSTVSASRISARAS